MNQTWIWSLATMVENSGVGVGTCSTLISAHFAFLIQKWEMVKFLRQNL